MLIELSQLGPEGVRVEETFGAEDIASGGRRKRGVVREASAERAELRAFVRREGRGARASGRVDASIRAECDRCLKEVTVEVSAEFDQRYTWTDLETARTPRARGVEEVELTENDLDEVTVDDGILDTRELAREQVELATPIRAVCSEACAGLCASCGADLNAGPCGCEEQTTDPRWDALKNLKTADD